MSVETRFWGKMFPADTFRDKVTFGMGDIYLRHKWIKADCFAASKLYTNMDQLRLDKGFGFYSQRFNGQDPLAHQLRFNKGFDLEIMASIDDWETMTFFYRLVVQCKGCTLSNSVIRPTPSGPIESHTVAFASATITQFFPEPVTDEPYRYRRSKWDTGNSPY